MLQISAIRLSRAPPPFKPVNMYPFVNWSLKTCTRNYVGWAWSCVVFHSQLLNTEILPLTRTGKDLGRLAVACNLSCRKWVLDPLWGPTFNQQGFGRSFKKHVSSSLSPKLSRKVEPSWLSLVQRLGWLKLSQDISRYCVQLICTCSLWRNSSWSTCGTAYLWPEFCSTLADLLVTKVLKQVRLAEQPEIGSNM